MQRAALNFDLTLKGCYYVFKIYNNRVIFYNNAKFVDTGEDAFAQTPDEVMPLST